MRTSLRFRLVAPLALALVALAMQSCASTRLAPVSTAGSQFEPESEEKGLWAATHAEERELLTRRLRYTDPRLLDYLDATVARLTPPGMVDNRQVRYRVRVILDPALNAFAYPHGSIYIHSGLLVRLDNEHQLAALLGHEMTHVERRHTLRRVRNVRNKQLAFSIAELLADAALAHEARDLWREAQVDDAIRVGVLGDLLLDAGMKYAFLAAVNGYGRSMENESDIGAFEKMLAAGYDVREMPNLFRHLLAGGGEVGAVRAYFYGTHPRLVERIESAESLMAERRASVTSGPVAEPSEEFIEVMAPLVRDHARFERELRSRAPRRP